MAYYNETWALGWRRTGWDIDHVGTVDLRTDVIEEGVWLSGTLFGLPYQIQVTLEQTAGRGRVPRCPGCSARIGRPPLLFAEARGDGLVFGCKFCLPEPTDSGPNPAELRAALAAVAKRR
jgi:hypothetical protein